MDIKINNKKCRPSLKDTLGLTYIPTFSVGDVVRVVDEDSFYLTYDTAIRFFDIPKTARNLARLQDGRYKIYFHRDFYLCNWVVLDAAIHGNCDTEIVYLISNNKDYAIVDKHAIEHTYITNDKLEKMRNDFKNSVLRKII